MKKKMKIAFAAGIQILMIGVIGDYVGWPYMKYVFILAGLLIFTGFVLFMAIYSKD